jgi:hypothetical protein
MSVQVRRRREAAGFLSTFTGGAGELLVDTTNNRVQVHDGATPGGFAAAKLSEVSPLSALMVAAQGATHGSAIKIGCLEDIVVCSGASSASTQLIPNRAIVFGVSIFVVTAITGASSFNVDATTSSSGGAGAAAGQFGSGLGILAGSSNAGVIGPTAWYAASTIKLTANGSGFTGGVVRVAIHYLVCAPPTS